MNADWLRPASASVNRRKKTLTITMVGDVVVSVPLARIKDVFPNAIPVDDPRMLPEFMGILTTDAAARKAASIKSPARAATARKNGAKGGRPPKKQRSRA
jgi:hypothetical protein